MPVRDLLLALLVVMIWGLNFVVIKVGLHGFPPMLLVALRYALAAFPAVLLVKRPALPWRYLVGYGLTQGVIHFGLLFWGLAHGVSAGMGSLILQLQAFFAALLGMILLGERLQSGQWFGMLLAFYGIGVIALVRDETIQPLGLIILMASAFFWGVANLIVKRAGQYGPFAMLTFIVWTSLIPPLPMLGLSLLLERQSLEHLQITPLSIGAVAYIAFLSTLLGFGLWTWLLSRYPASQVAPLSLLVPVFGMSSSALLLDETFTPLKLMGAALIVAGLIFNVFGQRLWRKL